MERLVTKLDTNLGAVLREQLDDNFEKIQNGVDGQSDALNKQITDLLGDVAPQDQNEVTQARIDSHGKSYDTLKGREDVTQTTAETALSEERATSVEVQDARTNSSSQTYQTLKERMDNQENDLNNSINDKLAQISATPETFANLAALQSKYPTGKTGLFVMADTGHKYIWANGSWSDAGAYQGIAITDDQLSQIQQSIFNQDNMIKNGYFVNQDGVIPWGSATLSIKRLLNKYFVSASSTILEQYSGLAFEFNQDSIDTWRDYSGSIFDIEFDIVSAYDSAITLQIRYENDQGTQDDVLTNFYLKSNREIHQHFKIPKNPYFSGNYIKLVFSNYIAEKTNFSIANLKIKRSSYYE